MLDAGVSRNVTPPTATAILDVRSTPDWTHEEIAALLRSRLDSEVVVTSKRLVPCETPPGSRPPRRRPPRAARIGAVREPDLLRLGVPAPPGRDQGRPRHQPPLAHAR